MIAAGLAASAWLVGVAVGQESSDEPTHDTPLNHETFAQWRSYLSPAERDTKWRSIPWRESFWAGVMDAQKQRKPVLLWAMNGHPLGCT